MKPSIRSLETKTSTEFVEQPKRMLQRVRKTGKPLVVTVRGKPSVVMVAADDFEHRLSNFNFSRLIAEAEADIKAGRVYPMDEVFKDIYAGKKFSR